MLNSTKLNYLTFGYQESQKSICTENLAFLKFSMGIFSKKLVNLSHICGMWVYIVYLPTHPNCNLLKDCGLQTNEPIANRCFKSLDELEAVLFERCRKLLNLKQLISGLTHFYWWPEAKV